MSRNATPTETATIVYPVAVEPAFTEFSINEKAVASAMVLPGWGGLKLLPGSIQFGPQSTSTEYNGVSFQLQKGEINRLIFYEATAKKSIDSQDGGSTKTAKPTDRGSQPPVSTTALTTDTPAATTASPTLPVASATSSTAPSRSNSQSTGLNAGTVAGIAIGCLVAGGIIAGLVSWFCWRRKRSARAQYSEGNTLALMSPEKGFTTNSTPVADRDHTAVALGGLPQPLEDKAISGNVSKISNSIKNHVQSYYHTSRVSSGLVDYDDLHALGPTLPISVGTLATLMGNPATREIALRFIIAWVVVSRMKHSENPSQSLLPAEVATCYNGIATGDHDTQFHASLIARWRVMTAELMQSNYARNPFSPSDSRHASIKSTFNALDSLMRPFADSRMNNDERKRNLEELLKRAALFAFTLFSQPSSWEFEWQEEQGVTSGELCIFPALMQVTDETGRTVSPPRPFSEAVIRRLDA